MLTPINVDRYRRALGLRSETLKTALLAGNLKTLEEYKAHAAELRGINFALQILAEQLKKDDNDEE